MLVGLCTTLVSLLITYRTAHMQYQWSDTASIWNPNPFHSDVHLLQVATPLKQASQFCYDTSSVSVGKHLSRHVSYSSSFPKLLRLGRSEVCGSIRAWSQLPGICYTCFNNIPTLRGDSQEVSLTRDEVQ